MKAFVAVTTIFSLMLIAFWSCSVDESMNCESLAIGLVTRDESMVRKEISTLIEDIGPDRFGSQDLDLLINEINERCNQLSALKICYGCIYVGPGISEISIDLDSAGVVVQRIIDIASPVDNAIFFKGLH